MEMFLFKVNSSVLVTGLKCFVLFLLTASCVACRETRNEKTVQYYNIDSLINSQIVHLTKAKATLVKTSALGNKADTISVTPKDSAVWFTELDVFHQLDAINKPINKNAYQVRKSVTDANSNLTITSFTARRVLPVEYLKLYYQTHGQIRKLEAFYHEDNSLYKSSRKLVMEFDNIYNKTTVTSYSITGIQKMFLSDSVLFSIQGKVTIQ